MASIWQALSASVRGTVHEHSGLKNQDAVRLQNPVGAADCLILAVADGHGSARSFRSDLGSALATECALRLLRNFVRRQGAETPLSSIRRQMQTRWPRALVSAWRSAVRADIAAHPFSALDFAAFPEPAPVCKPGIELPGGAYLAYGTTLVVVAITRRYILYSQLGDGDILVVKTDGGVSRPFTRHHKFFANETVSLCSHQVLKEFQIRVEPVRTSAPALIMLSTDGYANCFGDDDGFFKVGADFLSYLRRHGAGFVGENLAQWLSESSRDGSGDDITVGLAARTNALHVLASSV